MFANQEIRYQPQPNPLAACTPYPAFSPGARVALAPPTERHPQQDAAATQPHPPFPGGLGARSTSPRPSSPERMGEKRREKEG